MNAQIVAATCSATHLIDYESKSTILDVEEQLLLSNLPRPWTLVCESDNRSLPFLYKS